VKALVLAGGAGTRLRPITHTSAKQLVPVANKPILFYGLEAMAEAGISEVGVIVGDTAEEVMRAVGDGSRFGIRVTYVHQEQPLGLAHCVLCASEFLGDDDFVMYLGDNLLRSGITDFVAGFADARRRGGPGAPAAQILLAKVPDPERFGVAELDERGRVVRLVEKPPEPPSDLALVGVYLFDRRIHEAVRSISPSHRGELEITDAIQWLIDHGHPVLATVLEGWWKDTGELEALLEGNRLVLEAIEAGIAGSVDPSSRVEGRVVLEAGASLVRSVVRGPAVIGRGTLVEDSFVGPFTSIAEDCTIKGSEVEHSIILAGALVEQVGRLTDSLIGRSVVVRRAKGLPRSSRLMVGDHSRVELA
jgi:glucose-1-phosphate thymidylyltransferase